MSLKSNVQPVCLKTFFWRTFDRARATVCVGPAVVARERLHSAPDWEKMLTTRFVCSHPAGRHPRGRKGNSPAVRANCPGAQTPQLLPRKHRAPQEKGDESICEAETLVLRGNSHSHVLVFFGRQSERRMAIKEQMELRRRMTSQAMRRSWRWGPKLHWTACGAEESALLISVFYDG